MQCSPNSLFPGVLVIQPKVFHDPRGYFFEGFQAQHYRELGIKETFVQDNFSRSVKNTVRGLHYQLKHPQGKLVGVIFGTVYDVVVDIRRGSPTFGQWQGFELSAENCTQLYIQPGFAHGFCVLSEEAYFYYKCTDYYVPGDDFGIVWNDASLGIRWPLTGLPILSNRDNHYPSLAAIAANYLPLYEVTA